MKPILGTCQRCRGVVWLGEINGVRSAVDLAPVDAQRAVDAVVSGRMLLDAQTHTDGTPRTWSAHRGALRPGAHVYAEHVCGSLAGYKPLPAPGGRVDPPVPPAGPSTPSTAPSAGPWTAPGARSAATPRSNPRCSECGERLADGTYWAIEHGGALVYACHADPCGQEGASAPV